MENRVYLNDDWKFSEQFTEEMLGDGFDVGNMTPVRLPHTAKETPLHYFDESVYQMVSGYRRDVYIPEEWKGKRLLLTIDGAAHESEVYWNGKKIGEHHCGYTAFTMDISDDAVYGIRNTLVVKVDSRESVNIPPFGFVIDYMTYGGLYREVWLDIKEKTHLKDVFVRGDLSGEDRVALIKWLEASPEHLRQFRKILQTEMRVSAAGKWRRLDRTQERVWERITPALVNRKERLYLWGMRIVAIIIVLIGVFFAWQIRQAPTEKFIPVAEVVKIESGSPKAILVMNAGEPIELKEGESRQVADVFGVKVIQDSTGGLRFEDREGAEEEIGKSSVIVPEKGEYFVILSDGTKVWINSDSELEFPNRFGEDIREVKLKGEAYFEVTSDSRKPFYVLAGETKVHVLGTAFNVSAYREDRQTEVALLRGKVSFDVKDKVYVLVPGEIATLNRESGETIVRKGDVAAIVDWKAGRFNFEDMSLEELTVKLSRWYGVTFVFSDEAVKKLRFSGAMTKYRTLDYVLDMISKTTDVTFSLKENRVTVSSKK